MTGDQAFGLFLILYFIVNMFMNSLMWQYAATNKLQVKYNLLMGPFTTSIISGGITLGVYLLLG